MRARRIKGRAGLVMAIAALLVMPMAAPARAEVTDCTPTGIPINYPDFANCVIDWTSYCLWFPWGPVPGPGEDPVESYLWRIDCWL